MTVCFKLMKAFYQQRRSDPGLLCSPCVYFSKNLDKNVYPLLMEKEHNCGLGFLPGNAGCTEMRTDNCSVRKF